MPSIVLLADGESRQAAANARGRLFEDLMTKVIKQLGYTVTEVPRRNYGGMEIDIEARAVLGGTRLYAECKYYSEPLSAPSYQAFFGKFMGRWAKERTASGLFIAVPGLNGAGWAFHEENVAPVQGAVVEIIEQQRVADLITEAGLTVSGDRIRGAIREAEGTAGDQQLLCLDAGIFWAQYVIPPGNSTPTAIAVFNHRGARVIEEPFLENLVRLNPEFEGFQWLAGRQGGPSPSDRTVSGDDTVVEVRGSSAYFEYQFPAAPEYFVGRTAFLDRISALTGDILSRDTSARSVLIEAASGWGKSSFILSAVDHLRDDGHLAIAIDSRSASSSQFVLQVASRLPEEVPGLAEIFPHAGVTPVTGFDGAVRLLEEIDRALQAHSKLLFVFFDQFENVFFLPNVLGRVQELFAQMTDLAGNIVLGFAWKTDLVGVMDDFPFERRDAIRAASRVLPLPRFGEEETTAMLERLGREMKVTSLRQDLRFLLSEYSQGYPWLLKKLCAHVRTQKLGGSTQADIAASVLNVDELFDEDIQGLSSREEEILRAIAKAAPIAVSELSEEFDPGVVQSLVNQRLVVRVANKYDVYWDIFRDYLNTGKLPVQENYILRLSAGSVLPRVKQLSEAGGTEQIDSFAKAAGLGKQSLSNVLRDMRTLGLVSVDRGYVSIKAALPTGDEFDSALRSFLREKLVRNRIVRGVLDQLEEDDSLPIEEVAVTLAEMASYVSATQNTWSQYARALADWLDFADLAVFDSGRGALRTFAPFTEVRERKVHPTRRRSDLAIPRVQYTPVIAAAQRLVTAALARREPEWEGLSDSTVRKALGVLSDLEFILRQGASILLTDEVIELAGASADRQASLFAERALRLRPFAAFVEILREHADQPVGNAELGRELGQRLGFRWRPGTAETNAKIMIDWARHTGLAPGAFAKPLRGPRRRADTPLFST